MSTAIFAVKINCKIGDCRLMAMGHYFFMNYKLSSIGKCRGCFPVCRINSFYLGGFHFQITAFRNLYICGGI